MKYRMRMKKLAAIALAGVMCLSLGACQSGGKEQNSDVNPEFIYVAEYQSLPQMQEDSYVGQVKFGGNNIYYTNSTWSEEGAHTYVNSMEVGQTEGTQVEIKLGENESVNSFDVDQDGNFILLTYWWEDMGDGTGTQKYAVKKFGADGAEQSSIDLSEIVGTDGYVRSFASTPDGKIILCNGDEKIFVLNPDGSKDFELDMAGGWVDSMGVTTDGRVFITTYETDGQVLKEIDMSKKAFGNTYTGLPQSMSNNGNLPAGENGFLLNAGSSLYEYNIDKQSTEEILNWIDSDINNNNVQGLGVLEDGRIGVILTDYSGNSPQTELALLTKTDSSQVAEKEILTYGTMSLGYDVRSEIINFNKNNTNYRIRVKEYGTEDYETGLTQMNSEIVAGNGPDIIDLSNGNISQYAAKGILEDLKPYMEKDPSTSPDQYVDSVLKAMEIDGKLYYISPSFAIQTVIGKTADVGSEPGWTIDELMAYIQSKPEGSEIFSYATKASMLNVLCMMDLEQFVDPATGQCSFNSDDFIKILEFANTFPEEYDYSVEQESEPSKIQNGKVFLYQTYISAVTDYQVAGLIFQEPITCIGYPVSEGSGSKVTNYGNTLGISSKSKHKDAAWEFISTFIKEEYQNGDSMWGFPILKSALDAQLTEAMTPQYSTDENGNQIEVSVMGYGWDDFSVEIYAAKQEEVDAVRALIDSVDTAVEYNQQISTIISEEAAPFFEGQKSASEVADIIQSRVQIYINENR